MGPHYYSCSCPTIHKNKYYHKYLQWMLQRSFILLVPCSAKWRKKNFQLWRCQMSTVLSYPAPFDGRRGKSCKNDFRISGVWKLRDRLIERCAGSVPETRVPQGHKTGLMQWSTWSRPRRIMTLHLVQLLFPNELIYLFT